MTTSETSHIPVPTNSGAPETCYVGQERPLPCIVILIHGVNDIGEAYENLDKGICAGLNQRLGRSDLRANTWGVTHNKIDNFAPRMSITEDGHSPIIPFYWGYRPVDKDTYYQEQAEYAQRLKKSNKPELPYDSYWIERETGKNIDLLKFKKLNCDKFGNWIDELYHRNGGPFSDATTSIPDMYGPGFTGTTNFIWKHFSDLGEKIYENPHRIYMVFAAQRLAELIIKIREHDEMKDAPINIVAHSQGTLITMLANMIVSSQDYLPADCVILTHSPYALEPSYLEEQSKEGGMGVQTALAREQTFVNFVNLIKADQKKRTSKINSKDLFTSGVANCNAQNEQDRKRLNEDNDKYYRDNFGKVYNYFSPNDQVVSLRSVQGIGWQGIPDKILNQCITNLRQRVFSHQFPVGEASNKLICYRPSGTITIPLPDYIDRSVLLKRMIEIQKKVLQPETVMRKKFICLTKNELDLINKRSPMQYGKFYEGLYSVDDEEVILSYQAMDEIAVRLKEDSEQKNYSKTETGDIKTVSYPNEILTINGEEVPEPTIYVAGKPSKRKNLNKAIYYSDFYKEMKNRHSRIKAQFINEQFEYWGADTPKEPLFSKNAHGLREVRDKRWLEKVKRQHPEWGVVTFILYTNEPNTFKVCRNITESEIREIMEQESNEVTNSLADSSHHSGITLSETVPEKIVAYDLALGEVKGVSLTDKVFWFDLIHFADWRSEENNDEDTQNYVQNGIIPKQLKKLMNHPEDHGLDLVFNQFEHVQPITEQAFFGALKGANAFLKGGIGGVIVIKTGEYVASLQRDPDMQWPNPDPDLERKSS